MKFRITSIVLAIILLIPTVSMAKTGIDQYEAIEKEKNELLENVYEQLKEQNKENMYYLFEKEISKQYDIDLQSKNVFNKNLDSIEALSSTSYYFSNGGSVTYIDGISGRATINSTYLTTSQTQIAYNNAILNKENDVEEFILKYMTGPWGVIFSLRKMVRSMIFKSQWDRVINGTGRAHIMTISDPMEGQATVVYEWRTSPNANISNYSKIITVKYN